MRYSESIETLWRWYEENKDNIDKIITIPKAERLDEKYKEIIIENFTLLHAKFNGKEHKLNLSRRLNVKNSNVKKITQYINQLTAIYLSYTVIRIELGYKEDKFSKLNTNFIVFHALMQFHRVNDLVFDQILFETRDSSSSWIHWSYSRAKTAKVYNNRLRFYNDSTVSSVSMNNGRNRKENIVAATGDMPDKSFSKAFVGANTFQGT